MARSFLLLFNVVIKLHCQKYQVARGELPKNGQKSLFVKNKPSFFQYLPFFVQK
jgi:hypothetical protein